MSGYPLFSTPEKQLIFMTEALSYCVCVETHGTLCTTTVSQLRRLMNAFNEIPPEGNKKARETEERLKKEQEGC